MRLERCQELIQYLLDALVEFRADRPLDAPVGRIDLRRHAGRHGARARGQRDTYASLIVRQSPADDQAELFHAREHARQAWARDAAQLDDLPGFERWHLVEHAHDAPLLFGDAVGVEERAEMRENTLARLQQQQRQITVMQPC